MDPTTDHFRDLKMLWYRATPKDISHLLYQIFTNKPRRVFCRNVQTPAFSAQSRWIMWNEPVSLYSPFTMCGGQVYNHDIPTLSVGAVPLNTSKNIETSITF